MISLHGVHKAFGAVVALDGVDLDVPEGRTLALIGTSGCGKTTLLRLVNRLLEPDAGEVRVRGKVVAGRDPIRLRRGIGYVQQRGGLLPHYPVRRNVGLLGEVEGWDAARIGARADELLTLVNLDPATFGDRYPRALSGGQRQRVGIARALFLDPPVLLMDEPFGALDPVTRADLHAEFAQLERMVRKTIILVTHDVTEAFRLGDRVALMHEGRIVQCGTPSELRERAADDFVAGFIRRQLEWPGAAA